jgi:hypothetical protein
MQISTWLEGAIIACLFLIALVAPHSIAATQTAWLLGLTFWVARFLFYPPPQFFRSRLDYVLLGFFVLSGISGIFSYSPFVSIGKMRAASLFTIIYLVAQNVRSLRIVRLLAFTLIASCMVNVLFTAGQFAIGKGVKVQGVAPDSPLAKALFRTRTVTQLTPVANGDTVWQVDGRQVGSPEELAVALAAGSTVAKVRIYRVEWMPELESLDHVFGSVAVDRFPRPRNISGAQSEKEFDRIVTAPGNSGVGLCLGNDPDACFVDWICGIGGFDVVVKFVAPHDPDCRRLRSADRTGGCFLTSAET